MDSKKIRKIIIAALIIGLMNIGSLLPVLSAENLKPRLNLKTTAEKEIIKIIDGKKVTQNITVDEAKSGDIIVYTIEYKNEGMSAATDAFIIDPIPQGTRFIENSAAVNENVSLLFSIDCGSTFGAWPLKIKSKKSDGTIEEKNAPVESYTHIKWVFSKVMPGEAGKLKFKVKMY